MPEHRARAATLRSPVMCWRPKGSGDVGPSESLPLLGDALASPASRLRDAGVASATQARRLASGPTALRTTLKRFLVRDTSKTFRSSGRRQVCARPLHCLVRVDNPNAPRLIFIVEDDARSRAGLGELLRQNGYDVIAVASGQQALTLLRGERRADLILLDLRMPGMNGWQFRSEQRSDASLASIPVVVASAHWNAESEAATLGAVGCLRKPYDARELVATVRRFAA